MVYVFISYSRKNADIVERLRTSIRDADIQVWIDKVGLTPGTISWEQALRDAIDGANAVLLCASPDSRQSAFVRDEISLAKQAGKRIYPAWVAGDNWLDCVPLGMGGTQYADLRGENYATGVAQLIAALKGQETPVAPLEDEDESEVTPTPPAGEDFEPRNPYKGLNAFRAEDRGDFFGRDVLIAQLIDRLSDGRKTPRFLALLGASGSGKSSVMMAGLLPRLRDGAISSSETWTYLDPIVPGAHPIEKLTIALARRLGRAHADIRKDLLDVGMRGLHRLTLEISEGPVVLYIDQFEEVFTLTDAEAERRQFIDLLVTAASDPDGVLVVLLSMRADFYDRPLAYPMFGDLFEKQHVAIKPMMLADLYDVVQRPANLSDVRLSFDDGLVTAMVFAVREEVAALPLLQFTLDQLFQQRDGHRLTLTAYEAMGGVQGALARHAEATYASLPSASHQTLARSLFRRLIEPGATEQDTTRRRVTYDQLALTDVEQTRLLQETATIFVKARLLVSDQSGDERTLEVSHEALIREWARLGEWLQDAREDLRLQKALVADVAEWQRRGQPADMLYRGERLAEAQAWADRNAASRDEVAFLHAAEREEKRRRDQEAALQRRVRRAIVGLFAVIVVAAVSVALIFAQNNADLQNEAATLQAVASTSEFQVDYVQAQVGWAATREFPLDFDDLTRTPAPAFLATATTQADLAQSWEPVIETFDDGIEMVLVPAGCFWMGSNFGQSDEVPVHEVCFDEPFWIDKYEVSNAAFERLGGVQVDPPFFEGDNRPVENINWFEARDFCARRGVRLPSEAEWEYAARGPDSLVYPWGDDWNPDALNWADTSPDATFPVGSFPTGASWVGALDMSGNVWEWVSTIYDQDAYPYPYDASDGRENMTNNDALRGLRGGSFNLLGSYARTAYRRNSPAPMVKGRSAGFRCARSYES